MISVFYFYLLYADVLFQFQFLFRLNCNFAKPKKEEELKLKSIEDGFYESFCRMNLL